MTLIRLFAIGKILGIELVPSDEVKIPPHKSICYARIWMFSLQYQLLQSRVVLKPTVKLSTAPRAKEVPSLE